MVVQAIIGEVVKARLQGVAPGYAEDVAVGLILSVGVPGEEAGRMGLLEALRAEEAEDHGEDVRAEATRGVLNRVEAQMTPWSPVQGHVEVGAARAEVEVGEVDLGVDLGMGDEMLLGEGDLMAGELLGDVGGMDLS